MDAVETTKKLFELIESRETGAAAELLSSDFTFAGPVPEPVDAAMWMGLHDRLNAAFPDFSFNMSDVQQVGDSVQIYPEIAALTNDMDLQKAVEVAFDEKYTGFVHSEVGETIGATVGAIPQHDSFDLDAAQHVDFPPGFHVEIGLGYRIDIDVAAGHVAVDGQLRSVVTRKGRGLGGDRPGRDAGCGERCRLAERHQQRGRDSQNG